MAISRKRERPASLGSYSNNWDTISVSRPAAFRQPFPGMDTRRRFADCVLRRPTTTASVPGATVYVPVGPDVRSDLYDYQKMSWDATAQWQSPDESMLGDLQLHRSQLGHGLDRARHPDRTGRGERRRRHSAGCREAALRPTACRPSARPRRIAIRGQGSRRSRPTSSIPRGSLPTAPSANIGAAGHGAAIIPLRIGANRRKRRRRGVNQRIVTEDYAANFKWSPTDRLHIRILTPITSIRLPRSSTTPSALPFIPTPAFRA